MLNLSFESELRRNSCNHLCREGSHRSNLIVVKAGMASEVIPLRDIFKLGESKPKFICGYPYFKQLSTVRTRLQCSSPSIQLPGPQDTLIFHQFVN